jgi:hypothetical protein
MAKRKMSTFERLQSGKLNRQERRELQQRLHAADPGLEIVHPDAAGIDVGNESHFVAVPAGRDAQPVQEFGSWTADLKRMAAWLKSCGIHTVAMQSTGVYWIAAQEELEEAGIEVYLVNARGTKNLPGKSDVQECPWLMKLHTYGLLRNSFRPPEEIRAVRTIWRLRDRLVKDAGRAIQQIQKALTTMNTARAFRIRLANAIGDISGVTGMAIIRAMLKGERDPRELVKLRDGRIQASEGGGGPQSGGELARRCIVRTPASGGKLRFLSAANGCLRPAVAEVLGGIAGSKDGTGREAGRAGERFQKTAPVNYPAQEPARLRIKARVAPHFRSGFSPNTVHLRHFCGILF